jgi:SPFH domain/Band 7 family protein
MRLLREPVGCAPQFGRSLLQTRGLSFQPPRQKVSRLRQRPGKPLLLFSNRQRHGGILALVIDTQTSAWGVKVTSVEVRDLELPQTMQRAMARQAEAEREKRAKLIHAEGVTIPFAPEVVLARAISKSTSSTEPCAHARRTCT